MRTLVVAALAALAGLSLPGIAVASPAPDGPARAAGDTEARKELDALVAEYDKAFRDFLMSAFESAGDGRFKVKKDAKQPTPDDWAPRFTALADKYPKDPVAAEALAWIAAGAHKADVQAPALARLLAGHVTSPAVASVVAPLARSKAGNAEEFLRAVIARHPARDVQGQATYSLAKVLASRGEATESEKLLDVVVARYADLKSATDPKKTLGDVAKADLFEVRSLAIGKPAPEIVGPDVDGKEFKLSAYRGKVVVLSFWTPG